MNVALTVLRCQGWSQFSISNGTRDSSATAYIAPAIAAYKTFDVLINAQATKLLQTGTEDGLPVFKGVQFARNANSTLYSVNATKELILSAGSVATPQLLMLSGIGNKTHLASVGIKGIVDLPDVGQHMQDHPLLPNAWYVNDTYTYDDVIRNQTLAGLDMQTWRETRKGQFSSPPLSQIGWFRLPDNSSIFQTYPDPSAGKNSAHFEFIFSVRRGLLQLVICLSSLSDVVPFFLWAYRALSTLELSPCLLRVGS